MKINGSLKQFVILGGVLVVLVVAHLMPIGELVLCQTPANYTITQSSFTTCVKLPFFATLVLTF